jgi:hypothetical protein
MVRKVGRSVSGIIPQGEPKPDEVCDLKVPDLDAGGRKTVMVLPFTIAL